jgi:hypothetical protein
MQASFSTPILKYSKYKLDGSGRDSYIFSNNGGLYQNRFYFSSRYEKLPSLNRSPSPLRPKQVTYINNGSGRDTYIQHSKTRSNSFMDTLRQNPDSKLVSSWKTGRSRSIARHQNKAAYNCSRRLVHKSSEKIVLL